MSNYPEQADVFTDKTGADNISSSDPNNAFDGIEATQGLIGALGKPQSWSTTLLTMLRRYRCNMGLEISGTTFYVRAGEAMLENTDATRYAMRRNTADVTITASNLDVGAMAAATYYMYATAGSAATTAPLKFSTDPNAPSGIGTAPYRRLGYFYNAAAGALTCTYAFNDRDNGEDKAYNPHYIALVNGTTPAAWADLDISAHIGANKAMVTFLFVAGGATREVVFRRNGDGFDVGYGAAANYGAGPSAATIAAGRMAYMMVEADGSGIVEWVDAQGAGNGTLYLVSYIK